MDKEHGNIFPNFKGTTKEGVELSQKDISKGPAVAGILVSWCLTCGYELVALQEIKDEFAAYKVPVIVFTYEDPAKFDKLIDSLDIDLPIIRADSTLFAAMFIDAIPTRILLENSCEAMRITGAPSFKDEDFRARLRKMLGISEVGAADNSEEK